LEEEQKLEKKKKICADISENLKDDDPDFWAVWSCVMKLGYFSTTQKPNGNQCKT
jgi:hypothetical protein